MAFSYRRLFFGGTTFCCYLPVRMGVISMSILGCLVAGLLTILLWFEISTTQDMELQTHVAFILAAVTETILFSASILGLVGALARKQLFTQIYAYTLYVHLILNVAVAAYLTYEVTRVSSNFQTLACQTAIKDPGTQGQCRGLLNIARWVYLVVAATVLLAEMYGAIIATRYLSQLRREKGAARARLDTENAFQLQPKPSNGHYYTKLRDPLPPLDTYYLGHPDAEFNPYEETLPAHRSIVDRGTDGLPRSFEAGYGGGSWTLQEIADDEKIELKQRDEMG